MWNFASDRMAYARLYATATGIVTVIATATAAAAPVRHVPLHATKDFVVPRWFA
jgi:hypothetical protein